MKSINWARVILGGIVAGILLFVGDGVVHGVVLKEGWRLAQEWLHRPAITEADQRAGFIYFAGYDLIKGLAIVFLYAAIRPRFGKGPKTALRAGAVAWLMFVPAPLLGLIPMHWFGRKLALEWALLSLVPMAIAALVGGVLYREAE